MSIWLHLSWFAHSKPWCLRIEIELSYSDWEDITLRVPQGSVLGLLLFSIFSRDLFLEDENKYFANYADDITPYFVGDTAAEVLENLPCL